MGIQLFKKTNINFTGFRRKAYLISLFFFLTGMIWIFMNGGLRYGVDFAGGVIVQTEFAQPVQDEAVKASLAEVDMSGLTVQRIGTDNREYMLRFTATEGASENLRSRVLEHFAKAMPENQVTIQRMEMVGPKVGADLRNQAVEALFYAILLITIYISGRFEKNWFIAGGVSAVLWGGIYLLDHGAQWFGIGWFNKMYAIAVAMLITLVLAKKLKLNFALGAIIALFHDVAITVGVLTVLGEDIDLNIIAALLTLVGYSLNDTIVVYDRIRENLRIMTENGAEPTMEEVINASINQTMSRTVMTSLTTLFACLSLFLLGGSVIHGFALTILIGIVVGTFSSVFVASPILLALGDVNLYRSQQERITEDYEKPGEHGMV